MHRPAAMTAFALPSDSYNFITTKTEPVSMKSENALGKLTASTLLARNTVFNLLGQGIPLLVAVFTIPILIREMGTDRFGILTLIWLIIGYFSLFDLGLGRALTQLVSERLGGDREEEIPLLVGTSLGLVLTMGLIGTVVLVSLTPWLVQKILKVPVLLQPETQAALYVVALALPMVTSISALRGVLEAHQRFDLTNIISSIMGVYIFLSPLIIMQFSPRLSWIAIILLIGRIGVCGSYLYLVRRCIPVLRQGICFQSNLIGALVRIGGWMTVSNVVGPLMVYLDRFLIGAFISVTAVAYYVTPYEVVTKLWLIPGALVGVLFPAISASFIQDRERTAQLFRRGVVSIFLILFPGTLLLVLFAWEIMTFWVGTEFAQHSAQVMQLIAIGVLINSLTWVPMALIQGAGRPDISSKLHLLEFPVYLCTLWWFLSTWGIIGAACVWVIRVGVDAFCSFYLAQRLLPEARAVIHRIELALSGALLCLALAFLPTGYALKGLFYFLFLLPFIMGAWHFVLAPGEKEWLLGILRVRAPKATMTTK